MSDETAEWGALENNRRSRFYVRFWHALQTRMRSLFFRDRREFDLREELQFHLERETERLVSAGVPPDEARLQAIRTFGAVEPTKEACRDARGTMLVDNVVRDVRFTLRSLRRAPLVAVTIVTTVALGLGLVAVVFTILNAYIFRVDEVRNPYELFSVERQRPPDAEPETFTRSQYETLIRETDVFADAFAKTSDIDAWIEGRRFEGPLVTGNYFSALGVTAAHGRTLTPSDDQPGGPRAIVLSHHAWTLHFAGDPGVLNRAVRVNGASFNVVGVMPEGFRGLAPVAAPDYWAPLSLIQHFRPTGEQGRTEPGGLSIVGRLKPGLSPGQARAQLQVWDSRRREMEGSNERAAASLILDPRSGTIPLSTGIMLQFMPLFFAFGLILMIGCANVANLLLARGVARQREIGIRLAVGASRGRVIRQLLTESLVLALVSAALAFGISRLVLAGIVYMATSSFPPDIGNIRLVVPPADWRVVLFLVAGAIVSTVLFALAPAFQATRLELVQAIRGEVMRNDGRPSRARHTLVALQVAASALLLICAGVFLRSSWAVAQIDVGIRTDGILDVAILNEQKRGAILNVVNNEPSIATIAAVWPGFLGGRPALAEGASGKSAVTYQFVSPEYFGVFDIDLVRGRGFTPTERSASAAVAIVSDSVARQLWPGSNPVGQILRIEPDQSAPKGASVPRAKPEDPQLLARALVVVGVARDVPGVEFGGMSLKGAGVYIPISADVAGTSLTMRVRGSDERARAALIDRLAAIDPNMSDVSSLRVMAGAAAYLLAIPFWVTLALGALALLLTLSGLFGVLSYLVEQRTREIGVRMALGATSQSIGVLVLLQSAIPVGIGAIVGATLTAGIGAALLATPAAEMIGSIVRLFDPVAYAASLICIVSACACAAVIPALRAARIDPVGALRQH
jgi:predicted permease